MDEQIKTGKTDQGTLSLKDLFYKYIRFLPLFLLSVALALLIAYTYLRYANQVYSAGGSMLIKSENSSNRPDKVEDILMGNNRSQNIQSEIEILKSTAINGQGGKQIEPAVWLYRQRKDQRPKCIQAGSIYHTGSYDS